MDHLSIVYAIYAVISLGLTIQLARLLSKSGKVFLQDVFQEQPELADAVNRLLVVGFYLVNFGDACLPLEGGRALDMRPAIETLAAKLGWLLLSLAAMHFLNMFVFQRIRRRAQRNRELPAAPQGRLRIPAQAVPAQAHAQPAQGPVPAASGWIPAPAPVTPDAAAGAMG